MNLVRSKGNLTSVQEIRNTDESNYSKSGRKGINASLPLERLKDMYLPYLWMKLRMPKTTMYFKVIGLE